MSRIPTGASLVSALSVLLAGLVLGACGGDETQGNSKPTTSATGTTKSTPGPAKTVPAMKQLVRRVAKSSTPGRFTTEASVAAGDEILLLTTFRNQRAIAGKTVRITIPAGGGRAIKISAKGPEGLTAAAEVKSRSGKRVKLANLQYTCLQPGKTFCPVSLTRKGDRYIARLRVPSSATPVALAAKAVSASAPRKTAKQLPRGNAKPAVNVLLRRAKPDPGKRFSDKVTASAGAIVQIALQVENAASAAGAKLELRLPRRGAKLTIRSGADGESLKSTATISASKGRTLKVSEIRYGCLPEPATFCPLKVKAVGGQYSVRGRVPSVPNLPIILTIKLAPA